MLYCCNFYIWNFRPVYIWLKIAERTVYANYIILVEFMAVIIHLYYNKSEEIFSLFLSFTVNPLCNILTFNEILFFCEHLSDPS
jgi:hypothetical protein